MNKHSLIKIRFILKNEGDQRMNKTESLKKLNRLKNILEEHSLSLQTAVGNKDYDKIYTEIGESLLWIIKTNDYLYTNHRNIFLDNQNKGTKDLLFGLRFAYNLHKHDKDLFELGEEHKRKVMFLEVEEYLWKEYKGNVEERDKLAFKAYKKYVENDVVLGTLGYASKFLRRKITEIIESRT